MGNICVGGPSMAHQVNSPDRASNNSNDDNNDVSSGQLLNLRHALADAAGLTREQHAFISNDAPASLRGRHNALYRRTQNTFHMADMKHRYMTGESGIHPAMRPDQNVSEMRRAISDWNDMREALQHAMEIHADMPESPDHYATTINPSGSRRMSTLSPYREW
ncbi:type III effector [Pseudomonas syringae]|uniref:type III effector n=1 Tax=Pseudomonas syringae TaxID=317 RepID=UPI0009EA9082